ncbi:LLM class flavin-dependent oxidoreductase [Mycolicibacterium litorale]|uniref:Phthiodiolone/phenolphthiodiolone dimycocerosates ketoreductase n=1 Tax=Mycolicibacterium litorale TaxID=758802 RepID=A0AAD1II79_9MYCO|nr:LLM class flavin-dependent oxidoreductase [Mycolicibacterium litorale]MCV7414744.1 LLM class flavin-dependent oxidoreductase [Mycolicibacterium litorale]TDY07989.1 phthiodiolone/phenolphthiodiolone dimycocerosates ketoreductase [Mycolicibacterium litorale]BBY15909.1 phthiodiolone/phenolphthiodiolone dimycocerosates ketoreductase [Mycolicibacterium litorale]
MNGFRFGLLDGLVNSRISASALPRAGFLTAAATGADSFWVGDHLNSLIPRSIATPEHMGIGARLVPKVDAILEPWTMLGHLAARNRLRRLRLGVCVTDAGRRNPAVTAQAAATLHLLTRGRAILGIGVGEREGNEPYGVDWTKPVARFEEAIATIRALWESDGSPVSRESQYFPLRNAVFDLPPYRGRWPEIWVAGHGPRMLRATGRYADAWVPFVVVRPGDYARGMEAVRAAASDAGRDPMSIIPAVNRVVVTGRSRDDVDEALDSVIMKVSALAAPGEAWRRHGVEHPLGADFSGVQDLVPQLIDKETALSYTAKVPASLMKEICFNGTADEVIDQVAEWRDCGLRYLMVINGSQLNPSLRKGMAASLPLAQVLRRLKTL